MVDIILKAKDPDRRTREYIRFKGGVTLLEGGAVSILTSQETRNRLLFANAPECFGTHDPETCEKCSNHWDRILDRGDWKR